jgi:2'-5' RNA ligase
MRLFVSVDLTDRLTPGVADIQQELRGVSGLDFTDPSQAHVTLKFLGEVPEERLGAVEEAVGEAVEKSGVDPFEATVEGIGAFPSREYIRVVWLGIGRGSEELTRLHEAIEARTTEMGFDPEDHDFTPHVTLARMDHAGGKDRVQRFLRDRDPEVGTMAVEAVRLIESDLGSGDPTYTTLAHVRLGE